MKRFELSGVYKITNKVNDKFYIGSGYSIFSRWFNHTCDLKNGTHTNYKLQRAFDKYGFSNFIFEVIELHPPEGLNESEQKYLDILCKAQEYIKGESNFFNQNTYNIKPLVWGTTGLPHKLESTIKSNRTRGFDRILKVDLNGAIISEYELLIQAANDNAINRSTVSKSIKDKKCPRFKDFGFIFEKEYTTEFRPSKIVVHNKGQKGVQTYESNWKEVFCYDIYGRFFKRFASSTATAEYFKIDTSGICRMMDKPKKKVLHRDGVHLYNLYSAEQEFNNTILEKLKQLENDGNIEVYTLFHEYLGSFNKESISKVLNSHLHSVSQAVTQCKLLKGFYFIRD